MTSGHWRDRAVCLGYDPELFFPRPGDVSALNDAKEICTTCPVVEECLEAALAAEDGTGKEARHGVFGGMSASGRYALYRATAPDSEGPHTGGKPLAECGTYGAYQRHLRYKEPVDDACREAVRLKSRARREREKPREPAACGTRSGYQRHRRLGEPTCDLCRYANAAADRRLRATGSTQPAA